jgi:hypothetical protein
MGLYILYLPKLENHLRHPCPENELGIIAVDLPIKLLDFVHATLSRSDRAYMSIWTQQSIAPDNGAACGLGLLYGYIIWQDIL